MVLLRKDDKGDNYLGIIPYDVKSLETRDII